MENITCLLPSITGKEEQTLKNKLIKMLTYILILFLSYSVVGKHAEYYRCGLQFLGCSIEEFPKEQWPQQAFFLGLAALLGEGVYNIGELVS